MTSITAIMKARNVEIMDYGLEAAIEQALVGCDEVSISVGLSQDNTVGIVEDLAARYRGRIRYKVYGFEFNRHWQEKAWDVAFQMSSCDWVFAVDADEGIHEDHMATLKDQLGKGGTQFASLPVTHFYGTPRYIAQGPAFYKRHCRIGHRSSGFAVKNFRTDDNRRPVCDVVGRVNGKEITLHNYGGKEMLSLSIPLWHYGWVRSARAMGMRRILGKAWYTNDKEFEVELPEKFNEFDYEMKKSLPNLKRYNGRHPNHFQDLWFPINPHPKEWAILEAQV